MTLRITAALALLLGVVALVPGPTRASKTLATATELSCTTCHDKPGSRLLTDAGKYYEFNRSMEGYAEIKDTFGKCTLCHDRKPGSMELTKRGLEFAAIVKDMAGLKEWVRQNHPAPPEKKQP